MCLLVCAALIAPRLTMTFIWLMTPWFTQAYETWAWPLLGWLFLPYTTLAYMAAVINNGHLNGWWLLLWLIAFLSDISIYFCSKETSND